MAFAGLARRCFELEAMREVGCRFAISDLTPEEWRGLKLVAGERNRMWKEKNEK